MSQRNPIQYLRSHWAGEQGFAWSFWINLVALRLLISLGQGFLSPDDPVDLSEYRAPLMAIGFFMHVVVLVWQGVGVLRAGGAHIRALGSMANSWGSILGVLVAFWLAISDLWGVWIATLPISTETPFAERMEREHAARYALSVTGETLVLTGEIDLGVTKAAGAVLADHPEVTKFLLNSPGGNIYEARGLAGLAAVRSLQTEVTDQCTSSCTVAFIGGITRKLGPDAQLGFHQYRIAADYAVLVVDPKSEEARDAELFRKAGVAEWFLKAMFQEHPGGMWYPDHDELRSAGVVTEP